MGRQAEIRIIGPYYQNEAPPLLMKRETLLIVGLAHFRLSFHVSNNKKMRGSYFLKDHTHHITYQLEKKEVFFTL